MTMPIGTPDDTDPYHGIFWGWDDESVFFVRVQDRDLIGHGQHVHRLQDHPVLMQRLLALCEDYFK